MGIPRHYKHHWNPPFVPLSLHGPESQQRCGLRILAEAKDPLVNFIMKFPLKWIYDDYDDICSGHTPFSDTPRQDIKCLKMTMQTGTCRESGLCWNRGRRILFHEAGIFSFLREGLTR